MEKHPKVGDTVYETDGISVYSLKIESISEYPRGKLYFNCGKNSIDFDERAIGSSIFLTREEAERHIKSLTTSEKLSKI